METNHMGKGGMNKRIDTDELIDEIGLDKEEIQWRKDFVGFTQEDAKRLSGYEDLFRENSDDVADAFYENIKEYDETVEVLGRSQKDRRSTSLH